jgi:hypothetical protein
MCAIHMCPENGLDFPLFCLIVDEFGVVLKLYSFLGWNCMDHVPTNAGMTRYCNLAASTKQQVIFMHLIMSSPNARLTGCGGDYSAS